MDLDLSGSNTKKHLIFCVFPKYVTNIQLFIGKRDICILTT